MRQSFTNDALGRNRTHISRTGILRAIRCTTRAVIIFQQILLYVSFTLFASGNAV